MNLMDEIYANTMNSETSQKENIEVEKFSDCEENRKDSDIAS